MYLCNKILEDGWIPESWKETLIIPVRKLGKAPGKLTNYRQITLTSCKCKSMERVFNERPVYFLRGDWWLLIRVGLRGRVPMDQFCVC